MRSKIGFSLALVTALVCATGVRAAQDAAARFTFTIPNAPESTVDGKGRFTLTLNRWSTEGERDEMLRIARERGTANLLDAFRQTAAVGYLRWPGGLEYSVRYARRVERPDKGADVVLLVERPLWVWWDTAAKVPSPAEDRFSVVQVRLNADGSGEGRVAPAASIKTDTQLGVLVADYASRPVLLNDVRREDG